VNHLMPALYIHATIGDIHRLYQPINYIFSDINDSFHY
jgi:hypothetical protein